MAQRQVFSVVIASGASTSTDVDLGGRGWMKVAVQLPTMSTGVAISVQNSIDAGSTFYNVFHPSVNSTTVATNKYVISALVGDNGGVVGIPADGLMRVRLVGGAVVSGGVAAKIICTD